MSTEIEEKTGTAYEAGMTQVAENVKAKGQEIQKLAAAGLPTEAVKSLQDKLAEYQTALQNKVTQQQREALNKLKTDTMRTNAELKGDYKSLADAEYKATVESLNKEKEERTKAVAQNKDDKEAMAAVEDWYTSQVQAAAKSGQRLTGPLLLSRWTTPSAITTPRPWEICSTVTTLSR